MDELLVKYLLGEAGADEQRSVQEWLEAGEENRRYFLHFKTIWEESRRLAAKSEVDPDQAWERFRARRDGNTLTLEPASRRLPMFRIAAAIALILVAGMAAWLFTRNHDEVVWVSADKVRTDTLPDGSVVTLNKNSTLAWAADFNKKNRQVKLTGEAFFNVAPDRARPFLIHVDEVTVQVVGTSFNVKNTQDETEVIVETGIVKVGVDNRSASVLPAQKAVVHKKRKDLEVEGTRDKLYGYYRTHAFVCNNTSLQELAEALSNAYDVDIVIPDQHTRSLTITTTFKGDTLNGILSVVVATFNLSMEQKNGQIILK